MPRVQSALNEMCRRQGASQAGIDGSMRRFQPRRQQNIWGNCAIMRKGEDTRSQACAACVDLPEVNYS